MRLQLAVTFSLGLAFSAAAETVIPGAAGRDPGEIARVQALAGELADELARSCPPAAPNDEVALNECRGRLYDESKFRQTLVKFVLWGRQRDPKLTIKESNLTQFGPDVLTGMYVSLFMFDGKSQISYSEADKLYRIELGAAFRNRLAPGQFPYPFWHEAEKWNMYQDANAVLLYLDPEAMKIRVAQFTPFGGIDPGAKRERIAMPQFDGKWLWTDEKGQTQPQATLFDGIFSAENPHIKKVEAAYREFALSLREGTCMNCHVPNNPNKMKRLVLLQSPAHAAAEIKRAISAVERDRMPYNDFGTEEPLKQAIKGPLLERARAFSDVVETAKAWEADNKAASLTGSVKR